VSVLLTCESHGACESKPLDPGLVVGAAFVCFSDKK